MIVNLTLKPTTYKAVRIGRNSYPDLVELFGEALRSTEASFNDGRDLHIVINREEFHAPSNNGIIIIAEFYQDTLTGVFVSDNTTRLRNMFNWEGDL